MTPEQWKAQIDWIIDLLTALAVPDMDTDRLVYEATERLREARDLA